ncbi:hypothetical protein N0V88_006027 [Collariella sp. IMI 366227]|nr:hypothetical protein N0V88_006027 [Collariella sp. IMI 366227]
MAGGQCQFAEGPSQFAQHPGRRRIKQEVTPGEYFLNSRNPVPKRKREHSESVTVGRDLSSRHSLSLKKKLETRIDDLLTRVNELDGRHGVNFLAVKTEPGEGQVVDEKKNQEKKRLADLIKRIAKLERAAKKKPNHRSLVNNFATRLRTFHQSHANLKMTFDAKRTSLEKEVANLTASFDASRASIQRRVADLTTRF